MNILQRNNVKKFNNNDPSTYPSNPEQSKKTYGSTEAGKGKKINHLLKRKQL
jgi:hypothetical protein